jgi:hypothetical protein
LYVKYCTFSHSLSHALSKCRQMYNVEHITLSSAEKADETPDQVGNLLEKEDK